VHGKDWLSAGVNHIRTTYIDQRSTTMKNIKRQILIPLLIFCLGTTFSQTTDSLNVFPNPFSSSATIHFEIVEADTISLQVYNNVGQTVRSFFQTALLPSGSYNINLLGDSLAEGIYFVRLDIGSSKFISKKAVKSATASIVSDHNLTQNDRTVFPNPTNGFLTIPVDGNKTIRITDLSGRILKSFTTDQKTISLLDLATGLYFITIMTNENGIISTQKILKSE
jgi:hypothetical protein